MIAQRRASSMAAALLACLTASCLRDADRPPPLVDAGEQPDAASEHAMVLPCSVRSAMQKCRYCHGRTPNRGATYALVTTDDFAATQNGTSIVQVMSDTVQSCRMPLCPMALTAGERDALLAWLGQGAPAGQLDEPCQNLPLDVPTGCTTESGTLPAPGCTPTPLRSAPPRFHPDTAPRWAQNATPV